MATTDLNVDDLEELISRLVTAGVPQVSLDMTKLNLPGVWVNVRGFSPNVLAGLTIKLELVALSGTGDPLRALRDVQASFNAILAVLRTIGGPSADPYTGVWQQQGNAARMAGIAVPFDLVTTQQEL